MKVFFISLLWIGISFNSVSQDTVYISATEDWTADSLKYKTDTIVFSSGLVRNLLVGTCRIPSTSNQINAYGWGLYFKKVTGSDCDDNGERKFKFTDRVNSYLVTDSSLLIDITIRENCCYDFLCDISIENNETLNLMFTGYGGNCGCTCCFGLVYEFELMNPEDFKKIKSITINGDPETLKKME